MHANSDQLRDLIRKRVTYPNSRVPMRSCYRHDFCETHFPKAQHFFPRTGTTLSDACIYIYIYHTWMLREWKPLTYDSPSLTSKLLFVTTHQ